MYIQSPAMTKKSTTPAKDLSEATKMQNGTPPTVNKTSWSKQSAVLLVNIVKDVEQKILKKELLVGKENEKTKWDYVAAFLHEVSPSDAGKTSNNCQYKFWELKRHFKYLIKDTAGKTINEEKEGSILSALKAYHGNSPPVEKKKRVHREIALFKESGNESEREPNIERPQQLIRTPSLPVPIPCNDGRCEYEGDSDGSLVHSTHTESVGHLATSSQAVEQSAYESDGSPVHHPNGEVAAQQLHEPQAIRGRPKGSTKRKASVLKSLDLEDVKEKGNGSKRLKKIVEKMARLTSYMKWKETGVGQDWRCDLTHRIERRQKRSLRTLVNGTNQAQTEENETQVPDEIEAALREDILSCWNELDKERPSADECRKYFLQKYAGQVCW